MCQTIGMGLARPSNGFAQGFAKIVVAGNWLNCHELIVVLRL
jgi:hypothetical protein